MPRRSKFGEAKDTHLFRTSNGKGSKIQHPAQRRRTDKGHAGHSQRRGTQNLTSSVGQIDAAIASFTDATEQQQAEAQLVGLNATQTDAQIIAAMLGNVMAADVACSSATATDVRRRMPMRRHKPVAKLFDEDFWGMQ